ncbi:MAG: hypothetical protein RJQ00_14095 [Vicingaceae bacterium]
MNKSRILTLMMGTFLVFSACQSSAPTVNPYDRPVTEIIAETQMVDGRPYWIEYTPLDNEEYFYTNASATGNSTREQFTIDQATNAASQTMAAKLEQRLQALQKSFQETVTSGVDQNYDATFSNVNKVTVNEAMNGTGPIKTKCYPMDQPSGSMNITCYSLVRMPVGPAKKAFENALSRDEELYVKFKASKAYEELQNEFSESKN